MVHGHRLDAGQRRLGATLRGAQEPREPGLARAFSRCEDAADRPQPSVERELADSRVPTERLRRDLPRGRQHRQSNWEVEPRPFLAQLGGREVDRDPAHRPLELR